MNILVAFPCLNPTSDQWTRLQAFIEKTKSLLNAHSVSFLVVDDGSKQWVDPPASLANQIRVHHLKKNLGKGGALKTAAMMSEESVDVFAFHDFDLPFKPEELAGVVRGVIAGADLCIGDRTLAESASNRGSRKFGHALFRLFMRMFITGGIMDTQCGIKAYDSHALKLIVKKSVLNGWLFDVEWIYIALKHRMALRSWPVSVSEGHTSTSLRAMLSLSLFEQLLTLVGNILNKTYLSPELYSYMDIKRAKISASK